MCASVCPCVHVCVCVHECLYVCACVCVCLRAYPYKCFAVLWLAERRHNVVVQPQALCVPVVLFDGGGLLVSLLSVLFGPSVIFTLLSSPRQIGRVSIYPSFHQHVIICWHPLQHQFLFIFPPSVSTVEKRLRGGRVSTILLSVVSFFFDYSALCSRVGKKSKRQVFVFQFSN